MFSKDGTESLGGAPLNVAIHAHQLASVLELGGGVVVSCVGADSAGERLLDKELAASCHAVCYGSLGQRSSVSKKTIRGFLEAAPHAIRMYDANLRRNPVTGEHGYGAEIVETSCHLATIIKVNSSELTTICTLLGIGPSSDDGDSAVHGRIEMLLTRFPATAVVLTRREEGTLLVTRDEEATAAVPSVPQNAVHPVGAGDACSAGILVALTLGWDHGRAVDLGNRMGASVASQRSATPVLDASILDSESATHATS